MANIGKFWQAGGTNQQGLTDAQVMRDVADDLAALAAGIGAVATIASASVTALTAPNPTAISAADPTAITAANAATQSGSYVQADVQTIATLANDLKSRAAEYRTLLLDLKARQAENATELTDLRARVVEARTLVNEIKTALNAVVAGSGVTIKTVKV